MSGAICLLAEENCIFYKIHVELALAACCSLRKDCPLELAQQLIEVFNDWRGRGYDDFVPGEVTKTAPYGDRTT